MIIEFTQNTTLEISTGYDYELNQAIVEDRNWDKGTQLDVDLLSDNGNNMSFRLSEGDTAYCVDKTYFKILKY